MRISMGCDHGGYVLKETIKAHLASLGHEVIDYGTYGLESVDYPEYARKAARAVASGECERGIVVCTTGIGVSITANKVKGIRCALCHDVTTARLTREHNDANMLSIGAGCVGENVALDIVDTFITTEFSHGPRHQRRIDAIEAE